MAGSVEHRAGTAGMRPVTHGLRYRPEVSALEVPLQPCGVNPGSPDEGAVVAPAAIGEPCKAAGRAAQRRYVHTIGNNFASSEGDSSLNLVGTTEEGRFQVAWERADKVRRDIVVALEGAKRFEEANLVLGCGALFRVLNSSCFQKSDGRVQNVERFQACMCDHVLCPHCARARSYPLQQKVLALARGKSCKFLTITVENVPHIDREYLRWLSKSFSKLRRTQLFSRWVVGGVYALDTTYNPERKDWHVHLHMVIEIAWPADMKKRAHLRGKPWLPNRWVFRLRREWKRITEGSHVINLKSAQRRWIKELCKYECKAATFAFSPELVDEYLNAFAGVRRIQSWGKWHGKAEPESVAEVQAKQLSLWPCNCGQCTSKDWRMVGSVHYTEMEWVRGELRRKRPPAPIDHKHVSAWGEEYWSLTPEDFSMPEAPSSFELPFIGMLGPEANPNQLPLAC